MCRPARELSDSLQASTQLQRHSDERERTNARTSTRAPSPAPVRADAQSVLSLLDPRAGAERVHSPALAGVHRGACGQSAARSRVAYQIG